MPEREPSHKDKIATAMCASTADRAARDDAVRVAARCCAN